MIKVVKINGIVIVLFCILGLACTQARLPCTTPRIASLNIECVRFPNDTTTVATDTALPAAVFGAITTRGIQAVIFPQEAKFTISLSSLSDTCKYIFTTDSVLQRVDTISFFYQRNLQFLSNACGFAYFYSLDSVKHSNYNIDSIRILNSSVTNNANITQLKIFIHPGF